MQFDKTGPEACWKYRAPPKPEAEFRLNVQLLKTGEALLHQTAPPLMAEFCSKTQSLANMDELWQ
jgi:hypothetical protein